MGGRWNPSGVLRNDFSPCPGGYEGVFSFFDEGNRGEVSFDSRMRVSLGG